MKGVYKITNHKTGKSYVGSSKDMLKRLGVHRRRLKRGVHRNGHLQNSWNKHKSDSFTFDIISVCEDYREMEQYILDNVEWSKLYNICKSVDSPAYTNNKSCYLLDLDGNIIREHKSMSELLVGIGLNPTGNGGFNTKSVYKKKYRAVTKKFYQESIDVIKSWKINPRTSYQDIRSLLNKLTLKTMYRLDLHREITYYKSKEELSKSRGYAIGTLDRLEKGAVNGIELSFGLFYNGKWLHLGKFPTFKKIKELFPFRETLTELNLLSFYICTTC